MQTEDEGANGLVPATSLSLDQLLDRFRGKPVSQPVIDVGFRIVERAST